VRMITFRNGSRRRTLGSGLAAALLVSLTITGCSSDDSGSNGDGKGSVSFLGFYDAEAVAPLIKEFEAAHEDIDVDYESVPFGELNQVIQSRLANGGETPDVYIADQPRVAALADQGFLLDLTDAVGDASDGWAETTLASSSVGDQLMALPLNTSTQILYYNKSLLDAAGTPYPSTSPDDRMTWTELVDLAGSAQSGGAQIGFQFDQVSRYYQLQPLVEALGGGSGLTGDGNLEADVTNDGWVEAMAFYQSLFEDGGVAPRGMPPEETSAAFAAGDVAFFLGGTHWGGIWEAGGGLDFELGLAPHPYFEGTDPVTPTGALSLGVNPNSADTDAATTFAEWVTTSEEGTKLFLAVDAAPPALTAALPAFMASPPWNTGEGGVTGGELIEHELGTTAVVRPTSVGYIQFEEIMTRAFEDIRNGLDVTEVLETAQSELDEALARLQD
jgi:ABC-type glycerol-3-phosphate transport system substrate-binding protein